MNLSRNLKNLVQITHVQANFDFIIFMSRSIHYQFKSKWLPVKKKEKLYLKLDDGKNRKIYFYWRQTLKWIIKNKNINIRILPKEIMFNYSPCCSGEKGTLANENRIIICILHKWESLDKYNNKYLIIINDFVN